MKLVKIQSSPVHCSLPSLRPKYLPQSLFQHLSLMFPLLERITFQTIQNSRQNYNYVNFDLFILRQQTAKQNILDRFAAGFP